MYVNVFPVIMSLVIICLSVCLCIFTRQKIEQAGGLGPETFFDFVWSISVQS